MKLPQSLEVGAGDAEIEITHTGGEARYIGPASSCGFLHIDVEVKLESDSGALDERFQGVLFALSATEVALEFLLHSPDFEIDSRLGGINYGQPAVMPMPLTGSLSIGMPIEYAPEGADPDDAGSYSLTDSGELAALTGSLSFEPTGVEGQLDAWMYGRESGVLTLAERVATLRSR